MSTWTVGQEVILRDRRYGRGSVDVPVTITRVARKYVYIVQHGREVAFRIEDGVEKTEGNYASRLFTPESLAEYDRRSTAQQRVAELTNNYSWMRPLTTEALEQIADLIERAQTDTNRRAVN